MIAAFTLSQAYRQPEVFYVRFWKCHFESGLAEVIYIDFGHSSTLDSFFLKQKLFTLVFRCIVNEVIYVQLSELENYPNALWHFLNVELYNI